MSLNLNDLMKKAKERDLEKPPSSLPNKQIHSPWREESILFTPVTTPEETVSKLETNWKQTVSKEVLNCKQSVSSENINRKQIVSATVSIEKANRKQTVSKLEAGIGLSHLVGVERSIVIFVYESCKGNMSHVTDILTLEHIANCVNTTVKTVKTAIQRLVKKGFLQRDESKNGRGGWTKYKLPEKVFKDSLHNETVSKVEANRKQSVSTTVSTTVSSVPSSSSLLNIKELTTKLPDEWNFDITPYSRFGFMTSQLKQLASLGSISATDVEQSLVEFSYDLDNHALPVIKTTKVNFLMGLLRAGNCYVSEEYKSEQEAAISEMARRAAVKRENLVKAKFETWVESINAEEMKEIERKLPTQLMVLHRTHGVNNPEIRNWLLNYYLKLSQP